MTDREKQLREAICDSNKMLTALYVSLKQGPARHAAEQMGNRDELIDLISAERDELLKACGECDLLAKVTMELDASDRMTLVFKDKFHQAVDQRDRLAGVIDKAGINHCGTWCPLIDIDCASHTSSDPRKKFLGNTCSAAILRHYESEVNPCLTCDCWDSDREGCTMPSCDKSYACSMG